MSDNKAVQEMSPKEWLEHIREKHGFTGNYNIPKDALGDLLSKIPESDREKARAIWMSRYEKTVGEVADELMQQYIDQILPVLTPRQREIANSTFFGIYPTRKVNGFSGLTPRGDRIVILHEGLGYTINFWSHWYLRNLDEEGKNYLLDDPEQLYLVLRYILRVWYGYTPDNKLPDIYPKSEDTWQLSEFMTLSAIAFVLGHEIGHIERNHKAYSSNKDRNHSMEYEADRVGLAVSIRYSLLKVAALELDNYYSKFMLFAPLFALAVMSLFGDTSTITHPSPSSRHDHLLASYEKEMGLILGEHFGPVVADIDEDLFSILETNSHRLFEIFSDFRELMGHIYIGPRNVPASQLRAELRSL
jgi:hypothetical protein